MTSYDERGTCSSKYVVGDDVLEIKKRYVYLGPGNEFFEDYLNIAEVYLNGTVIKIFRKTDIGDIPISDEYIIDYFLKKIKETEDAIYSSSEYKNILNSEIKKPKLHEKIFSKNKYNRQIHKFEELEILKEQIKMIMGHKKVFSEILKQIKQETPGSQPGE